MRSAILSIVIALLALQTAAGAAPNGKAAKVERHDFFAPSDKPVFCPYGAKDATGSILPEDVLVLLGAFGPWNDMNKVVQKLPGNTVYDANRPLPFGLLDGGGKPLQFFLAESAGGKPRRAMTALGNAYVVVTGPTEPDGGDWPYPIVREAAVVLIFDATDERDAWAYNAGTLLDRVYERGTFPQNPEFQYKEKFTERGVRAERVTVTAEGCQDRPGLLIAMRRC